MKITRSRLKQIIKEEMGLVQARTTTDPTLDQIESIAMSVVETNPEGGLMSIANALKAAGLEADVSSGALHIKETNGNEYLMGKQDPEEEKFDIEPGEDVRKIGKYVLGVKS